MSLRCASCGLVWIPGGRDASSRCPDCGSEKVGPAGFRFTLKGLAILTAVTLLLAIVIAGTAVRASRLKGRPRPAPHGEAPRDDGTSGPVQYAPRGPSKVGTIPCGYCNGDGNIDPQDQSRTQPPYLQAPLGRCPACAGKGGLGR